MYVCICYTHNVYHQQGSSPFGSGENLYKHLSDSSRPDDGANLSVGGIYFFSLLEFLEFKYVSKTKLTFFFSPSRVE